MKKRFLFTIIFLVIVDILLVIVNIFFVYRAKLVGEKTITTNFNEEYKDPGIIVKYRGKQVNNYKVESNVDTSKMGTYKVKYIIGKKIIERTVIVKDISGPVIELEGDDVTINYKAEYKDPGYKSTDNADGDLTSKVVVQNNINSNKLGEYSVTYTSIDSSNNETKKTRKVFVADTEKPNIKFNNYNTTYAILGKKIDLKDYEVTDNYDTNLKDKVMATGNVDFNKEGVYTLTYSVADSNNNEQSVIRTVNVQKKNTSGIPVLMYHWFYDDTKGEKAGTANAHNYISKTELTKQLSYLKKNNYYYPTWKELEEYIDGKRDLPKKSVIITDDDCDKSFFRVAVPVFQEMKIPVTSFCITKKTKYKKYLGKEYIDFQSHTDSMHVRSCNTAWDGAVMCSTYKQIYEDIKTSVEKLGNNYSFAYPFGHYNDNTIKALKKNGIKLAFTINDGRVKKGANKYKLPRVRISSWTTLDTYKNLVK